MKKNRSFEQSNTLENSEFLGGEILNLETNTSTRKSPSTFENRVVNVDLVGGLIGMLGVSPNRSLNKKVKEINKAGWKVVQIIPSASGNILLNILRFILLVCTLFLYTTSNGYYIICERQPNSN